jgi:hypothetical protein
MKASEARLLTQKSYSAGTNTYIQNVYKVIEEAAKKGRSQVAIRSPEEIIITFVINQLKKDGYAVSRNHGYDQRDDESWDNLDISWEHEKESSWDTDPMGG